MFKRFQMVLVFGLIVVASAAQADPVLTPFMTKIECTGKTSDNRAAQISIEVNASATSYPAAATAHLQLGTEAPETLVVTLTMSSGQDVSARTVYLFHSALDLNRVFAARTFDLHTGVGALKLTGDARAPMLTCTFTSQGAETSSTAN